MDKELSNFLEQREHTVLTDIDVITAAVAVPLLEIDGEDHVVFTVRSNKQPGEISFPGGHCEPNDKSGAHAAMRECSEELGIDLDQIELAIYGMEGLLCNLSTLFVAIILSFIFHTTYEFVLFIFFFIPLRLSYKSFHCSSFLQCLVFSNMIILFASYFIKYVTNIPFLRLICLSLIVANYTLSFEKNKRLHCIEILILYLCSFIDSSLLVIYLISLFINTILILLKRGENHV